MSSPAGSTPRPTRRSTQSQQNGASIIASHRTDVAVEHDVRGAVSEVVSRFGGLDIIVNAAAVHPFGTVVTTTSETWARCMAVNVGSIYLTAHFGIPEMERRGGGAIVNIASVQGLPVSKTSRPTSPPRALSTR